MIKKFYKVTSILIVFLLAVLLATTPVMAKKNKKTEKAQNKTTESVKTNDQRDAIVIEAENLIDAIDLEKPSMASVLRARDAYDALTMAQKTLVENVDKLIAAENTIRGETSSAQTPVPTKSITEDEKDDGSQKNGTSFTFRLSNYTSQVTLTIQYGTSDTGSVDIPVVRVFSPEKKYYTIMSGQDTITDDTTEIGITHAKSYLQLDIAKGSIGTWTVETSSDVTFVLSEYSGQNPVTPFQEEPENPTPVPTQPDNPATETNSSSMVMGIAVLVLFLIGIILCFRLPKMLAQKKEKQVKTKDTSKDVQQTNDADELQRMYDEWEKLSAEYQNNARPVSRKPKKEPVIPEIELTENDVDESSVKDFDIH